MATGDIKQAQGTNVVVTIDLSSLASSATFVAGRESTAVDNSTTLALDYLLDGKITVGTTPTANKEIRVYLVGVKGDASWPDVFDGTDSAETVTNTGILDSVCKLAAVIVPATTSDVAYPFGPISVASLFGGTLPLKFVVFVAHSTVAALHATAGNHVINARPVYETVAA